ncbi:ATP-grasp domain-containing protein [Curtobacterium sp. PhB115]|uniref:D-alanine--D-alanine ligase family protein n=1 Tax=Curtobacterium sp. PhB115 TaxID=2485173 RepID=UPI000F4B2EB4|nr:ATP-grasp domain-containing protein [Curtobacterium sp. PhB115]ROP66754.1 D-alanine-D-alanine ligase [Curtobacterium sp. PhB115]
MPDHDDTSPFPLPGARPLAPPLTRPLVGPLARPLARPLRVAVLGGGANDEHEVSLASAAAVTRAVRALGLEAVPLTIDRAGRWHDAAVGGAVPGGAASGGAASGGAGSGGAASGGTGARSLSPAEAVARLTSCDAAFVALHGIAGEDGAAAGLLTMIGVPVVGSPVRAGALGMDKWVAKTVAEAIGIRTAPSVLLRAGGDSASLPALPSAPPSALPFAPPFVVKPTTGGSSNGVTVVRSPGEYAPAVAHARAAGDDVLAEAFVSGREVDIAVFRDRTGALRSGATLEIGVAAGGLFDREQKYDGSARFTVPAQLEPARVGELERAAHALYETLGCSGVARFDFFVTADGVVLNEVNTSPGFTEQSQVPRMFAATGLPYVELVGELIEAALGSAHPLAGA